jgi:hypothetical protein
MGGIQNTRQKYQKMAELIILSHKAAIGASEPGQVVEPEPGWIYGFIYPGHQVCH